MRVSEQACANLGLCYAEVQPQTYWQKIQTTGRVVDRPGFTDRGITAPVDSVVAEIHALEGDTVKPGDKLFTLRIVSQFLQQSQSDYFQAISEIQILNSEIQRIQKLADSGVIPEKRIIGLKQEVSRQKIQVDAHEQELLSRGFDGSQLKTIAKGSFIKSIDVFAPPLKPLKKTPDRHLEESQPVRLVAMNPSDESAAKAFLEVQELKVQLGQQIQAGELLTVLANHNFLYITGHAFKKEAAGVARAAERGWDIEVEFLEDSTSDWQPLRQPLRIRHMSNTIDPQSRTFDFFIPLNNQSRNYQKNDETFVVWRFRPGQRVRIHVPVSKMENVMVVPPEAVIYDGPNAYVFQQNGDYFNRIGVQILYRDRLHTVIANDGSVLPGFTLAQNSAASLNRILKIQNAEGEPSGNFHVHADGTVHANH